jgi:acetylornithine/LysW-gamma-L-lysine aminotransferase
MTPVAVEELIGLRAAEDSWLIPLHAKRGISLARGRGVWLWDTDGRRYLDLMSNYGVNVLGHAHPRVNAALRRQLSLLWNCHQSFYVEARGTFLRTLIAQLPDSLRRVTFGNSGAEAVEAALKFARVATGRTDIIATHRAYHGRTFGALAATGEARYRDPYAPMLAGLSHVPFDDVPALEAALTARTAAVILEPIQGEAGVRIPRPEYLAEVRGLCAQVGALLILDEVQTAFRTGAMFAFQRSGIEPDILCLSKGIANGMPLGVTVVTEAVSERIPKSSHGSTFGGNPLVCAAAIATLEVLGTEAFQRGVRETGAYFLEQLRRLDHPLVREVRGEGLMLALELKRPVTPVLKALQERGVLALPAGNLAIRFLPPLVLTRRQVDKGMEALGAALNAGPTDS